MSTRDKVKLERNLVQSVILVLDCDEQSSHVLVPVEDEVDYLCELKDGERSLPIMNVTNSDVILKKGQTVKRGDLVELHDPDEKIVHGKQCITSCVEMKVYYQLRLKGSRSDRLSPRSREEKSSRC